MRCEGTVLHAHVTVLGAGSIRDGAAREPTELYLSEVRWGRGRFDPRGV